MDSKQILALLHDATSAGDVKTVLAKALGDGDGDGAGATSQQELLEALANETVRLHHQAQTANRVREVLFASVAHDLRNPLNTFAMSAGLLRDDLEGGGGSAEAEEASERESSPFDRKRALSLLSRMDRASARMQLAIEDLLEASRIEGGSLELTWKEVDAGAIVKAAIEKARPSVIEKGASIEDEEPRSTAGEAVVFVTDKARLVEALTKLVLVALKITGERGVIRLGALDPTSEDDTLAFRVRAIAKSTTTTGSHPPVLSGSNAEEHRGGLSFLIARGLISKLGGRVETDGLRTTVILKKKPH
jgi:two-component system, chemotaxis family, sensor kinase Cph1